MDQIEQIDKLIEFCPICGTRLMLVPHTGLKICIHDGELTLNLIEHAEGIVFEVTFDL